MSLLHVVLSHLLALLRCCRAVSFSDNVSDSEFAKNCKSATVDGEVLEPRCPTRSEMREGIAKEEKIHTAADYDEQVGVEVRCTGMCCPKGCGFGGVGVFGLK